MKKFLILGILLLLSIHVGAEEEIFDEDNPEVYESSGTYMVEIESVASDGTVLSKYVPVTIVNPTGKTNQENEEGIDARNFRISEDEIEKLEDVSWTIEKSRAYAWRLSDGKRVPIVSSRVEVVEDKNYDFLVWFSTEKGTTTSVEVFLHEGRDFNYINVDEKREFLSKRYFDLRELSWILVLCLGIPTIAVIVGVIYFLKNFDTVWETLYRKSNKE